LFFDFFSGHFERTLTPQKVDFVDFIFQFLFFTITVFAEFRAFLPTNIKSKPNKKKIL